MHSVWIQLLPAILVLTAVVCAACVAARRSEIGWRAWICYQLCAMQTSVFCRWKADNACPFPESGAAIIVANHSSPVDPVILWRRHFAGYHRPKLRLIEFMMAREYYDQPGVVGWVFRSMQCMPVARSGRDMAPVKEALSRLKQGRLLGLFPEGRLNRDSPQTQLLPGGTGVAWLALKAEVPVIPVFIHDAPRGDSMVRVFFKFTRTHVTYGRPVDLTAWHNKKLTHAVLAEVTDVIMRAIAELGHVQYTPTAGDGDRSDSPRPATSGEC